MSHRFRDGTNAFAVEKKTKRSYYVAKCSKYKHDALKAAKELEYGPKVIKQIEECNDDDRISQIMTQARKEKWDA